MSTLIIIYERPLMLRMQNEYLLSASNALGIFALSDGISRRPPLQWINNIISVSHVHPYVVVLNDEFMTVHRYPSTLLPFSEFLFDESHGSYVFFEISKKDL